MTERSGGGPEIKPVLVTAKDVVESYRAYQGLLQGHSITTVRERLAGYGNMLFNLNAFLDHSPAESAETQSAVRELFYNHHNFSPIPLDFFDETQKAMREQVLQGGLYRPGGRMDHELEFVRRAVSRELQHVTIQYRHEQQSGDRLSVLAAAANPEGETAIPAPGNTVLEEIQRKAVDLLASDKRPETLDLRDDLIKRRRFAEAAKGLIESGNLDPQSIMQALAPFESDLLKGEGSYSQLDGLVDRAEAGQDDRVKGELSKISSGVADPIEIFRDWSDKGWIPNELLNAYEEIIVLGQLGQVVEEIDGLSPAEKAKALQPFIDKDISAGLLLDIAEDRFEISDTFLQDQVDAFLHFYDGFQRAQPTPLRRKGPEFSWGTRETVIAAALATVVVAAPFVYLKMTEPPPPLTMDQRIDRMLGDLPVDETGGEEQMLLESQYPNKPTYGPENPDPRYIASVRDGFTPNGLRQIGVDKGGEGGLAIEVRPSGRQGGQARPPQEAGSANSQQGQSGSDGREAPPPKKDQPEPSLNPNQVFNTSERHKPKNDSIESLIAARSVVVWELEGSELPGYYRTHTSTYYDKRTREWHVYRQARSGVDLVTSERKDIQARTTFVVGSNVVELASREGYAISASGIQIDGEVEQPVLIQTEDGNYLLYFSEAAKGKQITLTYSLGKSERSPSLAPDNYQLRELTTQMIFSGSLPQKDRDFIFKIMDRKDLSQLAKARLLEKYMQQTFTYSLSPEDSDWYDEASDIDEYFKRIFERRRVDCDVANTVLVGLLRHQGIPARMVNGFNHSGGVLSKDANQILASEGHGWVEVFVGGKWVTLDGTPTKMDEKTRKALDGLLPSRAEIDDALAGGGDPNDMSIRRSPSGKPLPDQPGQGEEGQEGEGGTGEGLGEGSGRGGSQGSEGKPGAGRRGSSGQGSGSGGEKEGGNGGAGSRSQSSEGKPASSRPSTDAEEFAKAVEELRKWTAENNILTGVLTAVLLNAVFYSLAHAQGNNNNKLVEYYTKEVNRRLKRYAGPNADILEQRFLRSELKKIRRNSAGRAFSRKKMLIPPVGLDNLIINTIKAIRLHRLPYSSVDAGSVARAESPSAVGFFVEALGYSEKRVKREICEEAYREQKRQIDEQMRQDVESGFAADAFGGEEGRYSFYAGSFRSRVISGIIKMKEPKSLEEWKEAKARETASLYPRYIRVHNEVIGYKVADALARGADIEPDIPLTEDQFKDRMDKLYKYKEISWLCDRAKKQAMDALKEGFELPRLR